MTPIKIVKEEPNKYYMVRFHEDGRIVRERISSHVMQMETERKNFFLNKALRKLLRRPLPPKPKVPDKLDDLSKQ